MIGVFDSGVGGLSILKEIHALLPNQSYLYIADQAHVPYGPRPLSQVREFTSTICQYLIKKGCSIIVIACNTASAAALQTVREQFPGTPFVGLVPAVKPAAERTTSGRIAVLATPGTFHGKLYVSVKNNHAQNVIVYQDACPGLVEQIEKGELNHPVTRKILETALLPLVAKGIDKVVLGCTHYPFVAPLISEIVGPNIELIDPAPAIARRISSVMAENNLFDNNIFVNTPRHFYSTSPQETLSQALRFLLNFDNAQVEIVPWRNDLPPGATDLIDQI